MVRLQQKDWQFRMPDEFQNIIKQSWVPSLYSMMAHIFMIIHNCSLGIFRQQHAHTVLMLSGVKML